MIRTAVSTKNQLQNRDEELNYNISSHLQLQIHYVNLASNF